MVRRALPEDRPDVVACVTTAFAEDPAWAFLLGDEYDRLAPLFVGAMFDVRVASANVWVHGNSAAVAMWESPASRDEASQHADRIWARYRAAVGVRVSERLAEYHYALAVASPAAPYWYLGTLATHPEQQGQGLATAVLAPVVREADASGMACCLETSTEANRRFYERRGFTQATDVVLPDGPPTWWLRRSPVGHPSRV